MAIVADVNLEGKKPDEYISIKVPSYANAISYHGKYYYRTGSTLQELTGKALDEFILKKQGLSWDGIAVLDADIEDFDRDAIRAFRRKAVGSARLSEEDLDVADKQLFESLMLYDGSCLKRAAILLFHQDPRKWFYSAYTKIGYFDGDLKYQDEISGPLITMPDKVVDTIFTKYFKGAIRYEGMQRVEDFPVPRAALREAIQNATAHNDWASTAPIQIQVHNDKIIIMNSGHLPQSWTLERLLGPHNSEPHNPLIANAFFRAGMIEAWGRGIERMRSACKDAGKPEPVFTVDGGFMVEFTTDIYTDTDVGISSVGINGGNGNEITYNQQRICELMMETPTITAQQLSDTLGVSKRRIESNIKTLKSRGLVERSGSNKTGIWVVKFIK
jgi:ATP-dependent DNA helicase RecG